MDDLLLQCLAPWVVAHAKVLQQSSQKAAMYKLGPLTWR